MTNSYPTDDKHNRIRSVVNNLIGTEKPEELMLEIMEALNNTVTPVPDVGKYYTFVYNPKTKRLYIIDFESVSIERTSHDAKDYIEINIKKKLKTKKKKGKKKSNK